MAFPVNETYYFILNSILGVFVSFLIGYPAFRKRSLSKDGFIAAMIIGPLMFISGWQSAILMIIFFITSSIATKYKYSLKSTFNAAERKEGRNWLQAVGAGGVAAVISLIAVVKFFDNHANNVTSIIPLFVGMVVALAVSTADTWAVEIGLLSKEEPRLIVKPWVKVPRGLSGGVTLLGEFAAFCGALLIASLATLMYVFLNNTHYSLWKYIHISPLKLFLVVLVFGWIGEKIDSILGATIQVKYWCPKCKKITDKEVHKCGTRTVYYGGIRFIKNEIVNLITTAVTAILAAIVVCKL